MYEQHDQLVFSEDEAENEELMLAVYFWTKEYANRDEETWAFEDEGEYRVDEHGVAYSLDGHRLLLARLEFKDSEYRVPDGVVTICSMAFAICRQFVTLIIPKSVRLLTSALLTLCGIMILQVIENQTKREYRDIQRGDVTDYYLTENTLHLTHLLHLKCVNSNQDEGVSHVSLINMQSMHIYSKAGTI